VRKFSKRKVAATIAITAILIGGGGAAAIAYWSAGGTGSGSATTGTSAAINVTQTSSVTNLAPGGAAQALSGTFTTSNPGYVTSVTPAITSVTDAGGTSISGCSDVDYTLTPATINAEVANGDSWSGATIVFKDDANRNQDACKNATVHISYTVN
jgi:hypothetical protein